MKVEMANETRNVTSRVGRVFPHRVTTTITVAIVVEKI